MILKLFYKFYICKKSQLNWKIILSMLYPLLLIIFAFVFLFVYVFVYMCILPRISLLCYNNVFNIHISLISIYTMNNLDIRYSNDNIFSYDNTNNL